MGSAAAWQLTRRGAEVLLLEQFDVGHVLGGSHGSSRIIRLAYSDPFYVRLAAASFEQWGQLEDEAGERLRVITGVVDHGDRATVEKLAAAVVAFGHPVEWLNAAQARLRWPGLAFDEPVMFQPGGGRVDSDRTVAVLQRLAAEHGAEVRHNTQVRAVEPRADGLDVRTTDEILRARHVVVAVGAWAPELVGHLVPLPEITVTLEQPAHFQPLRWSDPWPSFIHHQRDAATRTGVSPRGAFGLACPDGVKVGLHGVGPVIDVRGERAVDLQRLRELQDYVKRWVPGVDSDHADPSPCLYDFTPDSDFVVDRIGQLTVATGFSGHGFKFTPEIGRLVADLVLGTGTVPDRFRVPS